MSLLNNIQLHNSIELSLPNDIKKHMVLWFLHGSHVYNTDNDNSDIDIIVIVDDNIDLGSNIVNNIYEIAVDNFDFQIINHSTFCNMINQHHIIALESMFMISQFYSDYNKFQSLYFSLFNLDLWKVRQTISSIVNNSYAKCHKKLTVLADYDLYRAQKSIFHCIRLYLLGIQLGKFGKIVNYNDGITYWYQIYHSKDTSWEYYKKTYKPILNSLHSEFVKYCKKPVH